MISLGDRVLQDEADGNWVCRERENYPTEGTDEEIQDPPHESGNRRRHCSGLEVRQCMHLHIKFIVFEVVIIFMSKFVQDSHTVRDDRNIHILMWYEV